MVEDAGGYIVSPSEKALKEKYDKVRSSLEFRELSTFKAKDLPYLLNIMNACSPNENDKKLMESLDYFINQEANDSSTLLVR